MNVERVFAKELAYIREECVRKFVVRAFDSLCPEYFWVIASSQRCHHPRKCQSPGGLVRHTKLAVRFGRSFMEMWPDPPKEAHDEVIAALLLHDMYKRGGSIDERKSFKTHEEARRSHGIYCANMLRQAWEDDGELRATIPAERARRIITAVRDHMGKWTKGFVRSQEDIENNLQRQHIVCITTHIADYASSRHLDKWLEELT